MLSNGTTDGAYLANGVTLPLGWSQSGGGGGGGGGGSNYLSPSVSSPSYSGQSTREGGGSVVYTACPQSATVGAPYSVGLASGETYGDASYNWTVTSGTLPPGLSLSSPSGVTDTLAGTPTTPGSYSFTIGGDGTTYELTGSVNVTITVGQPAPPPPPTNPRLQGFRDVAADGGVFDFGGDSFFGSLPGIGVQTDDIVGISSSPTDDGYWLAGSDGGVFGFGDALWAGSLPGEGVSVNDIVDIASDPHGNGYWLVGADGGVFTFGDAPYEGSLPGSGISVHDIVGIAPTPSGNGYWLVGADGGSSPTATPPGRARWAACRWALLSRPSRQPPTEVATGWLAPTAGSSGSATPHSRAQVWAPGLPPRSSASHPPPTTAGTGLPRAMVARFDWGMQPISATSPGSISTPRW